MDNPSYLDTEDENRNYGTYKRKNSVIRNGVHNGLHNGVHNGVHYSSHNGIYPGLNREFVRSNYEASTSSENNHFEPCSSTENIVEENSRVGLQKNIDFISCLGILVGGIIGSGIFISPKGVLEGTGSIGFSAVVWITCGFISLMGSLTFAELGLLLPNSGAQYYYMLSGFDPHRNERVEKSFFRPIIPFLFFWQVTFLSRPVAMALQGMSIAEYLLQLSTLCGCASTMTPNNYRYVVKLISALFIMIILFVNGYSNKLSTRLINAFTFIKVLALVLIIISGIVQFTPHGKTVFEGSNFSSDGLSTAFYSGLWAYSGWDSLNMVTKELVNPKRDLLRSLVITNALITSLYLLTNLAYFGVLSQEKFLASNAVAVDYAKYIAGSAGAIYMVISVASSILGATIGENFTNVRLSYAAAREGHMVDIMSYIDHKRMTPSVALILSAFLALIMLPHSSVLGLIAVAGFLDWIFMFLTMVSLLMMRRSRSEHEYEFKVPIIIPWIVMLFSVFLVVMPFTASPKIEYIYVISFLFFGVVFYTIFVYFEVKIPGLVKAKRMVQKILLVLPSEDEDV